MTLPSFSYGGLLYYDRTLALLTGEAAPKGAELRYTVFPGPADLFRLQCQEATFDIAEMSTSSFMIMVDQGDDRMVGLPIFVSRNFRHGQIYVHRDSGINTPGDLRGRRVGVFEYQMTAALWIRGLLKDDYGVAPEDLFWYEGGIDVAAWTPRLPIDSPDGVRIGHIPSGRTLEAMLDTGDLDALVTVRPPHFFDPSAADGNVRRLFPDHQQLERQYFTRTGIFPIMHLIVMRREICDRYPWLVPALLDAFEEAKQIGARRLRAVTGLAVALPWLGSAVEEVDSLFGGDAFPYGIAPNAGVLETMTRYAYEQGLTKRKLAVTELFVPGLV